MQTSTPHSYAHLKEQLAVWKAHAAPQPGNRTRQDEFLLLAKYVLQPELARLAAVMNEADAECAVLDHDDEDLTVGIHLPALQATLGLSPSDHPACIRAVIVRGSRPSDRLEWFIPYHLIRTGGLERELQAALLQLIKPLRAA